MSLSERSRGMSSNTLFSNKRGELVAKCIALGLDRQHCRFRERRSIGASLNNNFVQDPSRRHDGLRALRKRSGGRIGRFRHEFFQPVDRPGQVPVRLIVALCCEDIFQSRDQDIAELFQIAQVSHYDSFWFAPASCQPEPFACHAERSKASRLHLRINSVKHLSWTSG